MKLIAATAAAFIAVILTGNATSAFAADPAGQPAAKPAVVASAPLTLKVSFTGIEIPTGAVMLSLFASEADFDVGKPTASLMSPVKGTGAEAMFRGLTPGRYAIKAFHDVDGDGNMGTTPFGMPTEPFAFSNNAIGDAGPAKWVAASFDVGAAGSVHTINIR